MARKRTTSSFKEKLLYDNTLFYGINSVNSMNNEGYFKHLVNFDTDVSYQCLTPRQGWILTGLYDRFNGYNITLHPDSTVYFRDIKDGQYVFIDLSSIYLSEGLGDYTCSFYKTLNELTLEDNKIFCSGFSASFNSLNVTNEINLVNYLTNLYPNSNVYDIISTFIFDKKEATYIVDNYSLNRYIAHAKYIVNDNEYGMFIQFIVNDNRLYISTLDLDNLQSYDNNRNIASTNDVVETYKYFSTRAEYNSVGPILISRNGNYLMNTMSNTEDIRDYNIIATPYLMELEPDKQWVYTYSIYSTNQENEVYESPVYNLNNDSLIPTNPLEIIKNKFNEKLNYTSINGVYSKNDTGSIYNEPIYDTYPVVYIIPNPTDMELDSFTTETGFINSIKSALFELSSASVGITNLPTTYKDFLEMLNTSNYNKYRYIYTTTSVEGYNDNIDMSKLGTTFANNIMITREQYVTSKELLAILNRVNPKHLIIKLFTRAKTITITDTYVRSLYHDPHTYRLLGSLFNGIFDNVPSNDSTKINYTCTICTSLNDYGSNNSDSVFNTIFKYTYEEYTEDGHMHKRYTSLYPCLINPNDTDNLDSLIKYEVKGYTSIDSTEDVSIFETTTTNDDMKLKQGKLSNNDKVNSLDYYNNGLIMSITYAKINTNSTNMADINRTLIVAGTSLVQSVNITKVKPSDVVYMKTTADDEPMDIRLNDGYCVFNSEQGYRLVVWKNNKIYLSEATTYNWFKSTQVYSYETNVLKVIPYKNMLVVFTANTVYAIFPYEEQLTVETGEVDENGKKKTVQQTVIYYNTLPVLYNINCDKRYADVIKIYNKMILFYSTEGHLYVITPSATIDSDTEWTLKLVNQAADDILLNYKDYMNRRLEVYGKPTIVNEEDIKITSEVTIDYIKIRYSYDNYMYELKFDTTKARYTVYDSILPTCDLGRLDTNSFITKAFNGNIAIFTPADRVYNYDSNADINTADFYNWDKTDINTEIDTGIINLNNQWKKRFRSLRITYKNLDTHKLKYDLDVLLDDVYINTCMSDTVELKNIFGAYASEVTNNGVNVLENNSVLFDFMDYHSNKLITHSTNIPSIGKFINLDMRFKSKGKYKIQLFELIYKEHNI